MGFWDAIFGRRPRRQPSRSATVARQRLVEVLVQDHIDLPPDAMEAIRRDIGRIISKHLEIDADRLQINIRRNEREERLVADVPVRGGRRRRRR